MIRAYYTNNELPLDVRAMSSDEQDVWRFAYNAAVASGLGQHDAEAEAFERIVLYDELAKAWNEEDHPRHPSGTSEGGEFAPKDGGGSTKVKPEDFDASGVTFWRGTDRDKKIAADMMNQYMPGVSVKELLDGLHDGLKPVSVEFRLDYPYEGAEIIRIRVNSVLPEDGEMERTFFFYDKSRPHTANTVEHGMLYLPPSLRHQGMSGKLLSDQIALYKRLGIKGVLVDTKTEGNYVWAKYGFRPITDKENYVYYGYGDKRNEIPQPHAIGFGTEKGWSKIRADMLSQLDSMNVPADQKRVLRSLLSSDDSRALWAIADSPYGKDLLIKGKNRWDGYLDFSDESAMKRFYAYAGRKR